MGLACSSDGLFKLLGSKPERKVQVLDYSAPFSPASPAGSKWTKAKTPRSSDYRRFVKEVCDQEKWGMRLQEWEDQGGWHVANGGGRVGLVNMKNTCWLNSGLQCLIHLRPLAEHMLQDDDSEICFSRSSVEVASAKVEPQIVQAMQELLRLSWQNHECDGPGSIAPGRLRRELRHYCPWLVQRNIQQDAQEFLAFMLDALHEELKVDINPKTDLEEMCKAVPVPMSKDVIENGTADSSTHLEEFEAAWAWAKHLQNAQSPIVDMFQGQLRSLLTCQACGNFSRTFDAFLHLSVPVQPGVTSLSDSLKAFAAEEYLSGSDSWACDQCGKKVEATKRMELYKLPPVIMIHLKRFSFDSKVGEVRKVPAQVQLPGKTVERPINLEAYCASRQRGHALYDIIGIVNHHGNDANGGHYTAHCYHCVEGKWYAFDDTTVTEIEPSEVWLPESAYVLFLMKRRVRRMSEIAQANNFDAPIQSSNSFRKHVTVAHQSMDSPEHWPYMCNLVGIRRQLQLFNYMPANIDLEKLADYRLAYQRFRLGNSQGAKGELMTSLGTLIHDEKGNRKSIAVAKCGTALPEPLEFVVKSNENMSDESLANFREDLAAFRTEYQRWRMKGMTAIRVHKRASSKMPSDTSWNANANR